MLVALSLSHDQQLENVGPDDVLPPKL
jgi:hypothetical protein